MFNDWTLPKDTALLLADRVRELRPALTVEFGSGFSTAILALYSDRLISLDNSREHAAPWPCVRICKVRDGRFQTELPDGVDFVLIDGPTAGKHGRHNTFPQVWPHLTDTFEVWLDDHNRRHEQTIVADWADRYPITVQHVDVGRGVAIIRRST